MELKQLVALVAVAEFGSVTAAARVLHLVQPAVSRQIRSLEEELGTRLFERTRTGMVPTDVGGEFIARAQRALTEIDRAEALARRDPSAMHGTVTVGLLESVVELIAIPFADAVRAAYPDVELHVLSGFSGHLTAWLASGDVDMSLLYSRVSGTRASDNPLVVESLWAVAPPDVGLRQDQSISWSELCNQQLVLPVRGHGLRSLIDLGLAEAGATPMTVLETNSMDLQKDVVRAGRAWTVLPAVGVARDVAAGRLSGAPLTGPPVDRTVTLAMAHPRATPAAGAVAELLIGTVIELVDGGAWPGSLVRHPPTDRT